MKYPISIKTSLKMNFKPNKYELYLFNRERDREERERERERRGRKDKREKIENFEIFYLIH